MRPDEAFCNRNRVILRWDHDANLSLSTIVYSEKNEPLAVFSANDKGLQVLHGQPQYAKSVLKSVIVDKEKHKGGLSSRTLHICQYHVDLALAVRFQ